MKKLLAMLLAVSMLLVLASCGDEPDLPVTDPSAGADSTNNNAGGDTTNNQGSDPEPDVYQPDMEAKWNGAVGVGTETGVAYFDNIKLLSKQSNKMVLVDTKLEDVELPTFTYYTAVGGDWDKDAADVAVVADPLEEYEEGTEEADKNHVLAVNNEMTGAAVVFGETIWNYYQLSLKVLPADENTVTNIYFCVKDENNYFVLSLGEETNTKVTCYRVQDGVKTNAAFTITYAVALDAYTPVGITVNREIIDIYIDGALKLSVFNPEFENQYYPYDGETVPSSITEAGYGAPGENLTYFPVSADNVLHDGKGTWGASVANIASNAFDMQISTFYDCDEKGETAEHVDDIAFGICGDGTYETAYVGAYFENGIKLTHVRWSPRSTFASRLVGAVIQVSDDGATWTDLYTIEDAVDGDYTTANVADGETAYKYIRVSFASGGYGNVAEIEFWGIAE